jgi:hypothetical protein
LIIKDADGKSSLNVSCGACKSQLIILHDKFLASFELDKPYPDKANVAKSDNSGENDRPSPAPLDDFFLRLEKQIE